jgi:probable F420-dependent oxidoreductase
VDTGIGFFATHDAIGPGQMAKLVEDRGHESLFFAEHTHIPVSRETPYSGGGELPRKYVHLYDLFVSLTAAAVATSTLRVGSGICLVIQRDPIITAKEVASVDRLSGGRLEFGVGAGWNREEMLNHGTDPRHRMAIFAERVEAMKQIWTQSEASYAGDHVSFERIWSWPKPAQWPHPPILVGGSGPTVLDRVLAFGDAWFPNHRSGGILERAVELRARAERPIELMVMGVPADPKVLEQYEAAGFRRAVHWVPSATAGPVERALDRFETAVEQLHGG